MTLSKPVKIAIAIASLLPIIYMIFFFGFIMYMMFSTVNNPDGNKEVFDFMPVLFAMHFAVIFLMFGLMAFYMIYLFKSDRVPQDKKVLWAIFLFMGNFIAMPIFWYFYIWPESVKNASGG
jgi:hypothetical protein